MLGKSFLSVVSMTLVVYFHMDMTCFPQRNNILKFDSCYSNLSCQRFKLLTRLKFISLLPHYLGTSLNENGLQYWSQNAALRFKKINIL